MQEWKPVDVVVVMLTLVIVVALGVAVLAPLVLGEKLTPEKAKLVASLFTSIISIVSMYVGASIQARRDKQ